MLHKKDVVVSIKACGIAGDSNIYGPIHLTLDGSLIRHPQCDVVVCREPFSSSDDEAGFTFLVEDGRITLIQGSDQSSQLVFEEGRKCVSHRDTDEGLLVLGVTANRVLSDINHTGGRIEVDYGIEFNGGLSQGNFVYVDISAAVGPLSAVPDDVVTYRDYFVN